MSRLAPIILAASLLIPAHAAAQSRGDYGGYGPDRFHAGERREDGDGWNAAPSAFDWRSQLDRPGDYRCDAYWDAHRADCGAGWRDQRRRASPEARRDYRELAGYDAGYGYGYGYADRYGSHGRPWSRRGYGSGRGDGSRSGAVYTAAYGRPDIVYPGGGGRGWSARDPGRIAWCRATYRSYDPHSGYYRAWSGRLIFCG